MRTSVRDQWCNSSLDQRAIYILEILMSWPVPWSSYPVSDSKWVMAIARCLDYEKWIRDGPEAEGLSVSSRH
jgi:hypothetical protein